MSDWIKRLRFRLAMWISPYDALAYRLHVTGLEFIDQRANTAIVECHMSPPALVIPIPDALRPVANAPDSARTARPRETPESTEAR